MLFFRIYSCAEYDFYEDPTTSCVRPQFYDTPAKFLRLSMFYVMCFIYDVHTDVFYDVNKNVFFFKFCLFLS